MSEKQENRLGKRIGIFLAGALATATTFNLILQVLKPAQVDARESQRQPKAKLERVVETEEIRASVPAPVEGVESENKAELLLVRNQFSDKSIIGDLYINGEFFCHTLELPYSDNQTRVSCIPIGKYGIKPRCSNKYGEHYFVTGTGKRDLILLHAGNYPRNTHGCVLVGSTEGKDFVGNSRSTMKRLRERLSKFDKLELTIENKNER